MKGKGYRNTRERGGKGMKKERREGMGREEK